jgi:hypothetical protein
MSEAIVVNEASETAVVAFWRALRERAAEMLERREKEEEDNETKDVA